MAAVPNFKLYYFDLPGKGEAIRLACAYGNVPLEDIRVGGEEFVDLRDSGKLPFGQLPILQVDDKITIGQSAAILRYVGKYAGIYPTDDHLQAAIIDSIIDEEIDLFTALSVTRYKDRMGFACLDRDTVLTIRAELNSTILPKHLQFLENLLIRSPTGWIAGGIKPSIADFCLVPRLEWLGTPGLHDGIDDNILDNFPMVKGLMHRLMNLPEIVAYYQNKHK